MSRDDFTGIAIKETSTSEFLELIVTKYN
jgi:hypothetical protein